MPVKTAEEFFLGIQKESIPARVFAAICAHEAAIREDEKAKIVAHFVQAAALLRGDGMVAQADFRLALAAEIRALSPAPPSEER